MTRPRSQAALALIAATLAAGCFDSLVDDPCAAGYELAGGACVAGARPDAGAASGAEDGGGGGGDDGDGGAGGDDDGGAGDDDGGDGSVLDGGDPVACVAPEAQCDATCVDLTSDPDHCGACGHACASGICEAARCLGELPGHVVVIGHDLSSHHAAIRRVLGNAVALGSSAELAVARLRGTATAAAHDGTTTALAQGMAALGRGWHAVALPAPDAPGALDDVDVLIVEAQTGDGDAAAATGAAWAAPADQLLHHGGVVIVLEGAGGVSDRLAAGAGLIALPPPVDTTGAHATIVDAADAVAQQVVAPYLAESSSAAFPGVAGPIATEDGTIVIHATRY